MSFASDNTPAVTCGQNKRFQRQDPLVAATYIPVNRRRLTIRLTGAIHTTLG
jgi:hypothetical protein